MCKISFQVILGVSVWKKKQFNQKSLMIFIFFSNSANLPDLFSSLNHCTAGFLDQFFHMDMPNIKKINISFLFIITFEIF